MRAKRSNPTSVANVGWKPTTSARASGREIWRTTMTTMTTPERKEQAAAQGGEQ